MPDHLLLAAQDLRLDVNVLDYAILALYFLVVLGIGLAARRAVRTSLDFFLSGRSLPAWITGLAFMSANLGAIEILGMAANGAQYGLMTVHYYWIGAVPAMVFLGVVMMPFYYRSKVHSVPEFLRRRFNGPTQLFNARNTNAARLTPIVAAYPKLVIPVVTVIPGLIALVLFGNIGKDGGPEYNDAIPLLMDRFLPNGVLGIAVTGLLASFMAGMAANISGFNTVFTYDIWKSHIQGDRPDEWCVRLGRLATVGGVLGGIGTAFIAAGFSNIMNYLQYMHSRNSYA